MVAVATTRGLGEEDAMCALMQACGQSQDEAVDVLKQMNRINITQKIASHVRLPKLSEKAGINVHPERMRSKLPSDQLETCKRAVH